MRNSNLIFVVYTTRDKNVTRELLSKIYVELSVYGDVYIDLLHNNAKDHQANVIEKLSKARSIVLIQSKEIEYSKWAQFELDEAKKQNKYLFARYIPRLNVCTQTMEYELVLSEKWQLTSA